MSGVSEASVGSAGAVRGLKRRPPARGCGHPLPGCRVVRAWGMRSRGVTGARRAARLACAPRCPGQRRKPRCRSWSSPTTAAPRWPPRCRRCARSSAPATSWSWSTTRRPTTRVAVVARARARARPWSQTRRNAGFAAGANAGARARERRPARVPEPRRDAGARLRRGDPRARDGATGRAWMGLVTAERRPRGQHERRRRALHRHRLGRRAGARAGAARRARSRSSPAPAWRCRAREWERAGGFAEEFFMYHEDVDLSLRLRLAGGRLGVEPAAVVDHDYEFAKGPAKWRLLERNRWATIVRCYPGAAAARCWRRRCWRPRWRCSPSRRPAAGCRRSSRRRARRCARCRGCCASGARSRPRARSRPPSSPHG